MTSDQCVLVILLASGREASGAERSAVAFGARLARSVGIPLRAAVLGTNADPAAREAAASAERVYLVEHPRLTEPDVKLHLSALGPVLGEASPRVVVLADGLAERTLAPRLAVRHHWSVLVNCTRLAPSDSGELEGDTPIFGGAAQARYRIPAGRTCVVVAHPERERAQEAHPSRGGDIVRRDPQLDQTPARVHLVKRTVAQGPKLGDARTIVAGGKGLLKKENYAYVEDLAAALGGMPAASRAIVDLGWATPAQQVGLTGQTVAPALYLAMGISGASQHMAGCSTAGTIVAVNTDRDAPIMSYARYGLVADCVEFAAAFTQACRSLKASASSA